MIMTSVALIRAAGGCPCLRPRSRETARDDRGDRLASDIQHHLGRRIHNFDLGDTPNELVSAANEVLQPSARYAAERFFLYLCKAPRRVQSEAVDFRARNPMTTGGADGLVVDRSTV